MVMLNAVSETAMNRTLLHFLALRSTLLLERSIEFFLLYGSTYVCTYIFVHEYIYDIHISTYVYSNTDTYC